MYNEKKILAIIPARAGSKRLPNKNILNLKGKPLITWTIDEAKKSKYIDKIIVSTDSEKIASISLKSGAETPFLRPIFLSDDTAKSIDVIFHAIKFLEKKGEEYNYVILLQPTSPLRTVEDIDGSIVLLNNKNRAVVSVCETEHSPLWTNILPMDMSLKNFIREEIKNIRSQDLPKYYRLNGAIYIADIEYLIKNNGFFGSNSLAFKMPQEKSIDIDTKIDLELCKILLNENNTNNS